MSPTHDRPHVCPWWVGYLLLNPLRRIGQNPDRILGSHVREGMTVLEVGPAMGFFSLALAHRVGPTGQVICVDVQERMLVALRKRARRADLLDRLTLVQATDASLRIEEHAGTVDFALAFAVVHEVGDQDALFRQIFQAMKPGARLLLAEPKGHVKAAAFQASVERARQAGFEVDGPATIARSHATVLRKGP